MKLLLVALTAVSLISAADLKLGKPFAAQTPIALATLLSHSDDYVGKTVQAKSPPFVRRWAVGWTWSTIPARSSASR
jgi:hypothetical protein